MKNRTLFAIALGLVTLLLGGKMTPPAVSAGDTLDGVIICLDPGHGGSDPGAVNAAFALTESEINLDVSHGLGLLLTNAGAEVMMTRSDDSYLTNEDRYTFCNAQQADLLVSVHTNSVTDPSWDGTITLYPPQESSALAQTLHTHIYPALRDSAPAGVTTFRDFGLDHFASGVLFKSDMPAAMVEPVFMSHPAEAAALQQPLYDPLSGTFNPTCADLSCRRGQIAQAILWGVSDYLTTPQPDSTLHVAAIEMSYGRQGARYAVTSRVVIQDGDGDPVQGATVTVSTTLPDTTVQIDSRISDSDGVATFQLRSRLSGRYVTTIDNVSKTDWRYDPAANMAYEATLTIP